MKRSLSILLLGFFILYNDALHAQDSLHSCKVTLATLANRYVGNCKKGLASGQGDAKGADHYTGSFKNGMPNGKGTYYYNGDTTYYEGELQDGLKEGKGEFHYLRTGMPDSIVKGYWSGDVYRGKTYITYSSDAGLSKFQSVDINPSEGSGNTISIDILTTSGTPNDGNGYMLNIVQINSINGDSPRLLLKNADALKSTTAFELHKFPAQLQIVFSDGQIINLELYKPADWRVRFYLNQ